MPHVRRRRVPAQGAGERGLSKRLPSTTWGVGRLRPAAASHVAKRLPRSACPVAQQPRAAAGSPAPPAAPRLLLSHAPPRAPPAAPHRLLSRAPPSPLACPQCDYDSGLLWTREEIK